MGHAGRPGRAGHRCGGAGGDREPQLRAAAGDAAGRPVVRTGRRPDQLPALARRGQLHRRALRLAGALRRPGAGQLAQGRGVRAPVRHGGGVRAAAPLRRRAAAVGRARRGRHRHDQLHQRDDGPAQGCDKYAPQHLGQRGHLRHAHAGERPRRLPAHAADVPLQRLGAAVHDGLGGRATGRVAQGGRRGDPAPRRAARRHDDGRGTGRLERRPRGRRRLGRRHPGP